MIKKLHYVWLGGKPLPAAVQDSIKSWRKYCPDWEIIQWNENNFPISDFRLPSAAVATRTSAWAAAFRPPRAQNTHRGGGIATLM